MVAEIEAGGADECAHRFIDVTGGWPVEVDIARASGGGVADEQRVWRGSSRVLVDVGREFGEGPWLLLVEGREEGCPLYSAWRRHWPG